MTDHNITTWFENTDLKTYYENEFQQNFTKQIKFPPKVLRAYFGSIPPASAEYDSGIQILINSIGELAITNLINHPRGRILNKIPFY